MTEQSSKIPIKPKGILKDDLIRKEYDNSQSDDGGIPVEAIEYRATVDGSDPLAAFPGTSFLLDRPMPLPTVPGYYIGTPEASGVAPMWQLGGGGIWWYVGNEYRPVAGGAWKDDPRSQMPLTLLRPAPDVVAEVLAEVNERAIARGSDSITIRHLVMENIGSEMGATK